MANGYIGKISAVVTANTSDLSRKLQGAVKDVDRFANTLNRSVSASAQRAAASLDNIFTPLQRLERKLQTALRLNLRTDAQVQKIQQLVSVAEGINKPLERAAGSFSKLSLEVQAAFLPALSRAQGEVLDAQGFIERLGRVSDETFVRVQRRVLDAAAAINQLSQAQQRLNSLATGNELQFSDPRLAGNLAAAQRAGQNALSLSPAQIQADPQIEKLVRDIGELSQRAVQAAANVKNIRFSGGDARAAQAQYDDINEELGILISRLNKKYTLVIDTEAAKKSANEIREALAFSVTGRARNFDQLKSQLEAARGEVEKFDAVQRRAFAKNFGRLAAIIETNDVAKLQEASDILGRINALIGARKQYDIDTAESDSALQRLQERLNGIAESLRVTPSDEFDRLEQSANDARAAIDKVADARARASLNRRAALVERGVREDAANPALTAADRRRRAGLDAAALGAIGRDAAEADRRVRESRLDRNAGASARLIDRVGPSVTALRGQLDGLAEPLRASVGPEVDRVTNKFRLLSRDGVAQSAEAVQRLKGEIAGLNAAMESRRSIGRDFLQSFGGSGTAGLGLGVDQRSLRAIGAEIEFVQTRLASLGQQARGPVLAALEALRVAANRLFQDGAIDTDEGRAELERLRQELIRVAATAENVKPDQFGAALKRAGDIARGSFGNVGLAVQQAAFAFEDFFSVTGGLDQRIRAAGNNLSQLGFILGSTKGLIAGIVIGIGAQFAAMLIKWANNGKTAEDQTKALNDALSRQRSTVNDLAQSIRSLSDSLADNVFSNLNGDIRAFEESVARLERRQAQARRDDGAAAGRFDGSRREPLVRRRGGLLQGEADLRRIDRELEAATDPVQAALLARQRRERLDSVNRARTSLAGAPSPSREDLSAILSSAAGERLGLAARDRGAIFRDRLALPQGLQLRGLAQGIAAGTDITARRRQLSSLREAEGILSPIVEARRSDPRLGVLLGDVTVEFERLQQAIALLERDISAAADRDIVSALSNIRSSGESLTKDIQLLESAVADSVTGAVEELAAREALGVQLRAARDALSEAAEIEDDSQRLDAVGRATAELQRIDAAIKARDDEVAAIASTQRSISVFSAALDRVSTELANTVAQEARSAADQARRDANQQQGVLDAGLGGRQKDADEAARRRDQLAAEAAEFERRAAKIAADNARARIDFERQAQAGGLGKQAQDLIRRRDEAQGIVANPAAPAAAVINAQTTLDIINTELRQIFEQSGAGQAAAKLADELDKVRAAAAGREELLDRGRDLLQANLQDAVKERDKNADAIIAAKNAELANIQARVAAGLPREQARQERLDAMRAADLAFAENNRNLLDQAAPTILGLFDQVQNAILQGPSRAALEATDVSTTDGSRELNRLLRGDDAARNQDLVQLQREANRLLQVIADGQVFVAN